jgi:serine/threonine protein kinase
LAKLHAEGLAHRDIKPANIIFVGGQPKLADIGMITENLTMPSQVGTPAYMPPDRRMDATADVYAMGRMMYELMAGPADYRFPKLPSAVFASADRWDLGRAQAVLDSACADKAEKRYPHAARMLEELEACRELSYHALLAGLVEPRARPASPVKPYVLACIHTLPWVLGLVLAIILATKLL